MWVQQSVVAEVLGINVKTLDALRRDWQLGKKVARANGAGFDYEINMLIEWLDAIVVGKLTQRQKETLRAHASGGGIK
ncbi:hypothetical protein ACK8OR_01800 [Jannaschia sp. KMU-145]|uniref:hypothetical protein n=1 Tax=Jannaschia halovivens TaxID=3388667 RepID=UPI00396B2CF4